jgi:hypothetical protein
MIFFTAFGSLDWRAASTAFAPSMNATRKCQRKVEMSYSLQSRNVRFWPGGVRGRGSLAVPVKRRRAMLASTPIKE